MNSISLSLSVVRADALFLFSWWVHLLIPGWVLLPVFWRLFAGLHHLGYLFCKFLAVAAFAYAVWLLVSLGWFPFRYSVAAAIVAGTASLLACSRRYRAGYRDLWRAHRWTFVGWEALFLSCLTLWAALRAINPDVRDLEKFMDYGLVRTLLRSDAFPPSDPWFSGEPVNYYYFGHYLCAFLSRWSHVPPASAYNLMIATLFAFTLCMATALAAALLRAAGATPGATRVGAAVAGLIVALGGNLHPLIHAIVVPVLLRLTGDTTPGPAYWYPSATRYIGYDPPTTDRTIHEFPAYSFVVSDLHAHVLALPMALTFSALLCAAVLRRGRLAAPAVAMGFVLALQLMTNPWDFPIYAGVAALTFLLVAVLDPGSRDAPYEGGATPEAASQPGPPPRRGARRWVAPCAASAVAVAGSLALALPFLRSFQNFSSGIRFTSSHTPLYQLLVLWGLYVPFAVLLVALAVLAYGPARIRAAFPPEALSMTEFTRRADILAAALALSAVGLCLIPELVYVRDIYIREMRRANTMFKVTYQAFVLFGLATGYAAGRWFWPATGLRGAALRRAVIVLVAAASLMFAPYGVAGYYASRGLPRYRGLDGLGYLQTAAPGDWGAIEWLNRNVRGQPTILEACGQSYSDRGRISMGTGLPTVVGWFVHEWLWRQNTVIVAKRFQDVAAVYESGDLAVIRDVLRRYHVHYLLIGDVERREFPRIREAVLFELGPAVYCREGTVVLDVSRRASVHGGRPDNGRPRLGDPEAAQCAPNGANPETD